MDKDFYYDGPVKDSERTLEEIERDLEIEKEKCDKLKTWEDVK